MHKIKIRTPAYSLVAADMSAAEVRTAANAAKDQDMINAYRAFTYEKIFKGNIELYSYEMINTSEGYISLHMVNTSTILVDDDGNQVGISKIEDEGEKNKLILADNLPHNFTVKKPGQDLYSFIASKVYKNKYEDNLEFYPPTKFSLSFRRMSFLLYFNIKSCKKQVRLKYFKNCTFCTNKSRGKRKES